MSRHLANPPAMHTIWTLKANSFHIQVCRKQQFKDRQRGPVLAYSFWNKRHLKMADHIFFYINHSLVKYRLEDSTIIYYDRKDFR